MYSYWEKDAYFAEQDIIIVGAGFVGLWSAIELKQKYPNYKITIIERGNLPTGASTKNAGFGCFGSPTELLNDIALYGEETVWNMIDKRYNGLRKIHNTFSYPSIDYENSGGYECLLKKESLLVAEKIDWLNKQLQQITGIKETFHFCKEKLTQFGLQHFDSLVENKLEGLMHPAKLVQRLTEKAIGLGVQILNGFEITSYTKEHKIILHTTNSINFICCQLLVCTNGFAKKILPTIDVQPRRGQVFITNPLDNLPLKGSFHFQEGFYYFRNVGNRLLIGGARNKDFKGEETDTLAITDTIQEELKEFVTKHILPNTTFTIEEQWSGIMGFGTEKTPIIKEIEKNIFCAVRMSGMGVALAPIVAEEVAAMI
jgi:glycine/D-amino acid oxidase-like deaminating enzyme